MGMSITSREGGKERGTALDSKIGGISGQSSQDSVLLPLDCAGSGPIGLV